MLIDELSILGPITVLELKFTAHGDDGKLVAKRGQFLEQRGIDLTGEQQTKTKTALEYFSAELR